MQRVYEQRAKQPFKGVYSVTNDSVDLISIGTEIAVQAGLVNNFSKDLSLLCGLLKSKEFLLLAYKIWWIRVGVECNQVIIILMITGFEQKSSHLFPSFPYPQRNEATSSGL